MGGAGVLDPEPDGVRSALAANRAAHPDGVRSMAKDYVADNLAAPSLDHLFPNMIEVDKSVSTWPWLRRDVDHAFRVDRRNPIVGFINRDEASILYSNARLFAGRRGLEIGAWRGWSTAHLIASGLSTLHVVEPLLADPDWRAEFIEVTRGAGGGATAITGSGDKSGSGRAPRRVGRSMVVRIHRRRSRRRGAGPRRACLRAFPRADGHGPVP